MIDEKRVLQVARGIKHEPGQGQEAPGGCQIRTGNSGAGT